MDEIQEKLVEARKGYLPEIHFFTEQEFKFFSGVNTLILGFFGALSHYQLLDLSGCQKEIFYILLVVELVLGLGLSFFLAKTGQFLSNANYDLICDLIEGKRVDSEKLEKKRERIDSIENRLEILYGVIFILIIIFLLIGLV